MIWFVRHGESVANAEGWVGGDKDADLTEVGVEQARALREVLRPLQPDRVVASDLVRAVRTAAIAWDHRLPPVQRTPEVRERFLGDWEGRRLDRFQPADREVLMSWAEAPPGGESHRMLARRALRFLASIDDGRSTLLFGHAGWIRSVAGLLDRVATDAIGRYKVANTEVIAREVEVGTWSRLLDALG